MKQQTKLSEEQQSRLAGTEQQAQQPAAREFATAEELLRFDAEHTTVPPAIARRLQQSTGGATAPKTSWWRKFLGGNL